MDRIISALEVILGIIIIIIWVLLALSYIGISGLFGKTVDITDIS